MEGLTAAVGVSSMALHLITEAVSLINADGACRPASLTGQLLPGTSQFASLLMEAGDTYPAIHVSSADPEVSGLHGQ